MGVLQKESAVGDFLSKGYIAENTADMQNLCVGIYRALSDGSPVTVARISQIIDKNIKQTKELLSKLPPSAVQYDSDGSITAFIGLSLAPTSHKFLLEESMLYTWCVFDGLFLPGILGKGANIITHCPATNEELSVQLSSEQLVSCRPDTVVMSVVTPEITVCHSNLRGEFCQHVSFFRDENSFRSWAKAKNGVDMIGIKEAYILAQQQNKARYKDLSWG